MSQRTAPIQAVTRHPATLAARARDALRVDSRFWAYNPRWQHVILRGCVEGAVRSRLLSTQQIGEVEFFTARLLGQPLSIGVWDRMTFNDKVAYRRLRMRDPRFIVFCDKLRMRDHVTQVLGDQALPALLRVADRARAFADLVGPFVLKANHGSQWVIVVDTARKLTSRELDMAQSWLEIDYGAAHQEWAYSFARRLLFAEEFLGPPVPKDYKFYVFHGRPEAVHIDSNRFGEHRRAFLRLSDWTSPGELVHRSPAVPEVQPENLQTMLQWASTLGMDLDFLRVDMYGPGDRVIVGELTCYPGKQRFRPASVDAWLGSKWKGTGALLD